MLPLQSTSTTSSRHQLNPSRRTTLTLHYRTFPSSALTPAPSPGYPAFKCVLRIRCDDETCKINLGLKYGADPSEDVPTLLRLAKDLGLQVRGQHGAQTLLNWLT